VTRVFFIYFLLSLLFGLGSVGALATPRTALVIGNGAYQNAPLANPPRDARAMADKLRALDFQVIEVVDVDRTGMRTAIRDFAQSLRTRGGVGLFFYAGHGVQVEGSNYLLPVGVDIQRAFEVPDEALEMSSVLRAMEHAGNDMNVVILDACRNNPFTRSFRSVDQGLARMEGPTGSLIAYSTAPGSVAADGDDGNSPYTRRLLEAMDLPGLTLEQVFKRVREGVVVETNGAQVPWEHSSLLGEFYFQPPGEAAPASQVSADAVPAPSPESGNDTIAELELAFWESIKDSDDPAYFQAYLEQYPGGHFASLATLRLESLTETASASRSATATAPTPEATVASAPATPTPRPKPAVPATPAAPAAPDADAPIQQVIQAARDGDAIAQGLLGRLLASGQGVPRDLQQAYVWSALAAERGVQDAVLVEEFLAQHLDRQQRRAADRQLAELRTRYGTEADRDRDKRRKPGKPRKHRDRDDDKDD